MENLREFAASLSEAKVSKYLSFCDYIETEPLGFSKPWSFRSGNHFNFYKNCDSDLTSNSCESVNNQINAKYFTGKKTVTDLVLFFQKQKREDFDRKLFAFRDHDFNQRKKSVRDRYTKQAEIFRNFESFSTEDQLSNLM